MNVSISRIDRDSIGTDTPDRLLEAAGEVFAEKGFRSATIREICKRAGANVAAVNYHFHNKENLYIAVVKYSHRCAFEKYPTDMGLDKDASAEERLMVFIKSFLFRILDEGRPAWHGRLMLREMIEPTGALDALVNDTIRPHFNLLSSIIREILEDNVSAKDVQASAFSIVGQCLFYCHARPVIERLIPGQRYRTKEIEELAGHINRFSLAALRRQKGGQKNGKKRQL